MKKNFVKETKIDINIPEIYFEEMFKFIRREFLLRNPEIFSNVKIFEEEGIKCLSFIIMIKPGTDQYLNIELKATMPIHVKISSKNKEFIEIMYKTLNDSINWKK